MVGKEEVVVASAVGAVVVMEALVVVKALVKSLVVVGVVTIAIYTRGVPPPLMRRRVDFFALQRSS